MEFFETSTGKKIPTDFSQEEKTINQILAIFSKNFKLLSICIQAKPSTAKDNKY